MDKGEVRARLMKEALDFCCEKEYDNVFLWTVEALHTVSMLYMKNGFKLTEEICHVGRRSRRVKIRLGFIDNRITSRPADQIC